MKGRCRLWNNCAYHTCKGCQSYHDPAKHPSIDLKAIFLKTTYVAGIYKNRWKCPYCNFRFNRSKKAEEQTFCPNCKKILELKKC